MSGQTATPPLGTDAPQWRRITAGWYETEIHGRAYRITRDLERKRWSVRGPDPYGVKAFAHVYDTQRTLREAQSAAKWHADMTYGPRDVTATEPSGGGPEL